LKSEDCAAAPIGRLPVPLFSLFLHEKTAAKVDESRRNPRFSKPEQQNNSEKLPLFSAVNGPITAKRSIECLDTDRARDEKRSGASR
jgi:hypothetical protein